MATVREGKKAVLMIVDVQVGVMQTAWDSHRIIRNINIVVAKTRSVGIPIIWVQHSDDELIQDSSDWQWVPELVPGEGETRIFKHFHSSFEQTKLEETLIRLGTTHIFLVGAATNWCIRATAYGALDKGYDLTLIRDAHTTDAMEFEDGTKIEAENIILELNTVMKELGYPGRVITTVNTADLDFST